MSTIDDRIKALQAQKAKQDQKKALQKQINDARAGLKKLRGK